WGQIMPGTATIVGGDTVHLSLNPAEYQAAQNALFQLGQGFSDGNVFQSLYSHPINHDLNIYNVPGGGVVQLPTGAQGIVLTGDDPTLLYGNATQELLVGNQGDDVILGNGGFGTIIGGDGNNLILTGGPGASQGSQGNQGNQNNHGHHNGNGNGNQGNQGTPGNFEIDLGSGNNTILVQGGSDTINALAGGTQTVVLSGNVGSLDINEDSNGGSATIID